MKRLILFIASLAAVFGQGFRLNPITGQLDLVGGYTAPSGYSATVTAQTTTTVTAASHGQGTAPVAYCFDNASPANAVACAYTVSSIGDVVFTWSPAFTGTVIIRGPGADAGAAGNFVGPSSSVSANLVSFSGTSGKIGADSGIAVSTVVKGAASLTTAGAVPYVASAGVLTQDATAFFWDAANDRLGIGTNAPAQALSLVGADKIAGIYSDNNVTGKGGVHWYLNNQILRWGIGMNQYSTRDLEIFDGSAIAATFKATTRNLLLGTTTDGNYKLDIAASGSSGTLRVYDQTATTGSTSLVVRAGAGQSGNLTTWQNSSGTEIAGIDQNGSGKFAAAIDTTATQWALQSDGLSFKSTSAIYWSSTSSYQGTRDLGLGRNAAGVLEINNGTAGTLRDLLLRYLQNTGVTVGTLPAAAAGNAGTRAYVTDANTTTIGTTVAGGGANKVMVWSDGTNWKIYAN